MEPKEPVQGCGLSTRRWGAAGAPPTTPGTVHWEPLPSGPCYCLDLWELMREMGWEVGRPLNP